MNVRCGACRTQFEVPGPGRFACPVCGSVNVVRNGPAPQAPPTVGGYQAAPGVSGAPPAPPPPPPERPAPKVTCPECDFNFIVGDIAVATCPMCGADVETGRGEPEKSEG